MEHYELELILKALKSVLKKKDIKYSELSRLLGVSEQTLKKTLNSRMIKLTQLMDICKLIDINFFDLVKIAEESYEQFFELTVEQEEFLAQNTQILAFYFLLLEKCSADQVIEQYHVKKEDVIKYLKALEKINLLIRKNSMEFTLTHKGSFIWLPHGPLMKKFGYTSILDIVKQYEKQTHSFQHFIPAQGYFSFRQFSIHPTHFQKLSIEMHQMFTKLRLTCRIDRITYKKEELVDIAWVTCLTQYPEGFSNSLIGKYL